MKKAYVLYWESGVYSDYTLRICSVYASGEEATARAEELNRWWNKWHDDHGENGWASLYHDTTDWPFHESVASCYDNERDPYKVQ